MRPIGTKQPLFCLFIPPSLYSCAHCLYFFATIPVFLRSVACLFTPWVVACSPLAPRVCLFFPHLDCLSSPCWLFVYTPCLPFLTPCLSFNPLYACLFLLPCLTLTPFCLSFFTTFVLLPPVCTRSHLPGFFHPLACFFYTLSLSVFFHSLACRFTSHLPVFLHSLAFLFSCPKLFFMPFACPFAPLCLSFHAPLPAYSRPLLACLFPIPCLSFYSPLPVFLLPLACLFTPPTA
jgi:hypothetical protein